MENETELDIVLEAFKKCVAMLGVTNVKVAIVLRHDKNIAYLSNRTDSGEVLGDVIAALTKQIEEHERKHENN